MNTLPLILISCIDLWISLKEFTLEDWCNVAIIVGVIIALCTLLIGVLEYMRQGAQKRAEYFTEIRRYFRENQLFKQLCQELDENSSSLENRPFKEKRELLGFFEDIALTCNSKLVRKQVVHYMFGYYMIKCWDSDYFWKNMNRDSKYWSLFKHFVEDMKALEKNFSFKSKKYRL